MLTPIAARVAAGAIDRPSAASGRQPIGKACRQQGVPSVRPGAVSYARDPCARCRLFSPSPSRHAIESGPPGLRWALTGEVIEIIVRPSGAGGACDSWC